MVPDIHARCLRRALDQKVRKLRTMLTADEDITTELDRIVCKLMKLALRTSRGRQSAPPTRWMQCKLLDLLTLTEKAIEKRKRYFIENYPLKSISSDDKPSEKSHKMIALEKIRDDDTGLKIVDKYRHLVQSEKTDLPEASRAKYRFIDMELEDNLSATSAEFMKDNEYVDRHSPSLYEPEPTLTDMALYGPDPDMTKLERTQAWLEDDLEMVTYSTNDMNFDDISSGDTEHSTSLTKYYKKTYKRYKTKKQCIELKCVICKRSHSNVYKKDSRDIKAKDKGSKTKVTKKSSKKKSSFNNLLKDASNKYLSVDYRQYRVKPRRKEYKSLQPTASKPIPASLIELCHPELMIEDNIETYKEHIINFTREEHVTQFSQSAGVAATEKSLLIDIVMDDIQETIAMKRTIGTDADGDPMGYENETLIRSVSNTVVNNFNMFDKHDIGIDNDDTIFLNDINEPSTSKGIRHVSMDVQCGPDTSAPNYSILSATTSITRMPNIFSAGIKIGDSYTDTKVKSTDWFPVVNIPKTSTDCCTLTDGDKTLYKTIVPRYRAVGIKIEESFPHYQESVMLEQEETTLEQTLPECITQEQQFPKRKQNTTKLQINEPIVMHQQSTMQDLGSTMRKQELSTNQMQNQILLATKVDMVEEENNKPKQIMREQGSSMPEQYLPVQNKRSTPSPRIQSPIIQRKSPLQRPRTPISRQQSPVSRQLSPLPRNQSPITKQQSQLPRSQSPMQRQSSPVPRPSPELKHRSPVLKNLTTPIHDDEQTSSQKQQIEQKHMFAFSESEVTVQGQESNKEQIEYVLDQKPPTPNELDRLKTLSPLSADMREEISSKFCTETKYIRPIPIEMKGDSGSEFCGSVVSIPKSPSSLANSDLQILSSSSRESRLSRMSTKYVRPKLCCGGVQVHSYRDKQTSEDVMYQGEWQTSRPKVLTKRKVFNPVIIKKTADSNLKKKVISKERIPTRSFVKREVKASPKTSPTRNVVNKLTKTKSNVEKLDQRTNTYLPKSVVNIDKPVRSIAKVPSKVTMSSATAKTKKPVYFAKKSLTKIVVASKDVQKTNKTVNKSLPYYLRRNAIKPTFKDTKSLKNSPDSAKTNVCLKINAPKPLVRSKTAEIKRDFFKFPNQVPEANYVVLRNEVEKNVDKNAKPDADSGKKRSTFVKRPISPQSQNSSTCSSPNSVATVRAVSIRSKNATNRRHSSSSYKTSTANSESETTTPSRNKKFTKRTKSAKMPDEKTSENKENIPQTSRQSNISSNASDIVKGNFMGQKKDVFIAQLKESPPLQSSINNKRKSSVNIPKTDTFNDKKATSSSKNSSLKYEDWNAGSQHTMSAGTEISNLVLVVKPQKLTPDSPVQNPDRANSRLITEWMNSSSICAEPSYTNDLLSDMRMLVEETLDFIDGPFDNNCSIDSETVILSREDFDSTVCLSSSPISFKTIITNDNNSLKSELEHALNSFDTTLGDESTLSLNDTSLTTADFDLLSFKSINSVSKFSEYLSAGSSQGKLSTKAGHGSSVKDIFERRAQPFTATSHTNAGAIAIQAFSGFSINDEPIAGDKPDAINLIDSETGSMAVDVSRQANSEELFVSGRSNDSFESCLLDEEAVVPSWLFQIISQQQAAEDAVNSPQLIPLPMPDEPMYDGNGNVVESVGLGAGAGDGRGMHSDQSQDSSGRGTSLSSSATSSGAQSEAILDPSAFVAQYEGVAMLQDSEDSSIVMVGINDEDSELGNSQGIVIPADAQSFSHGESRRNPRVQIATASDVDADVSSLETDVPDSSDN